MDPLHENYYSVLTVPVGSTIYTTATIDAIETELSNRIEAISSSEGSLSAAKAYTDEKVSEVSQALSNVVDNAPELFDTLKEVADWIGTAEGGATASIADLQEKKHTHDNKAELDLIESGDKAKWDAKQNALSSGSDAEDDVVVEVKNDQITAKLTKEYLEAAKFDTVKNQLLQVQELDPEDGNLRIKDVIIKFNEMLSALTPGVRRVSASSLEDVQAALNSIRDPGVIGNSEIVINITDSFTVTGEKALTIEDGKTVTLNIPAGVEITGGTLTDNATKDTVFAVRNGGTLIINGEGKITGGPTQYCAIKMTISGDAGNAPAKLVVNGCTLTGRYYAVAGNGNRRNGTIVINGGTLQGTEVNDCCGIFNPLGASQVTVNAGTIKGAMCVVLKSGNLVVNGGTFEANGVDAAYKYSGNGYENTGDCIFIESCNYPGGNPTATVRGGTFTSAANHAFGSYAGGANPPERLTGFVKTGTVTVDAGDTSAADVYA
jgi:hypothetical protein